MAPVQPVLHQLSCTNEMVRNAPKYEFSVQWSGSGAFILKNLKQLRFANLCVNAPVRQVLPQLSCSNETVGNAPKHEFCVQWSGSGAFVLKNFEATSLTELVH
jgi:hypothetical protein